MLSDARLLTRSHYNTIKVGMLSRSAVPSSYEHFKAPSPSSVQKEVKTKKQMIGVESKSDVAASRVPLNHLQNR